MAKIPVALDGLSKTESRPNDTGIPQRGARQGAAQNKKPTIHTGQKRPTLALDSETCKHLRLHAVEIDETHQAFWKPPLRKTSSAQMRSYINIHSLLFGLLLAVPDGLAAGPSSYVCQITDFKIPGTNAENRKWVGETAMETTVAIDRGTGRVIHPVIGNTSFNNVTLLNEGSPSWAFKAFADSGEDGHVRYYEVHEFDEGAVKAFLAVADGIAFFGECR